MVKRTTECDDPWQNMANAIIIRAVEDWRDASSYVARRKTGGKRVKAAKDIVTECEEFFKGEWIQQLTDVDGKYILETLQSE